MHLLSIKQSMWRALTKLQLCRCIEAQIWCILFNKISVRILTHLGAEEILKAKIW